MASTVLLKTWCSSLALLCLSATCCMSDENTTGDAEQAITCFIDHYIYASCQHSYRLNAGGMIDVPPQATDEFCDGPCLVETKLVLDCVEKVLHDFRFYNGASVLDLKYTLSTGCSHTRKRGDFNVANQSKVNPDAHDDYGAHDDYRAHDQYYDHGNRLSIPDVCLLVLLSSAVLLWNN